MAKHTEEEWLEKVVALLDEDKKRQWAIGDLLLEGETWLVPGMSGKDLHADDAKRNDESKGPTDEKVPFRLGVPGHDPYEVVCKRSGYDKSSLQDFMRVSRAFPAGTRVAELSWGHHQAAAAKWLTHKQRADLLHGAANYFMGKNNHTTTMPLATLREKVNKLNKNEIDDADSGVRQLSFGLPVTLREKLDRLAKQQDRTVAELMEQAVKLLIEHYKAKKAA